MIEAEGYFYEGARRMAYGFASPNFAGAVVAMALPLFWALQAYGEKRWHRAWAAAAWLAEYAVFVMVCRTFSRGALVAIVVAFAHHLALRFFCARPDWKTEKWGWLVRPGIYLYLAYVANVGGRMSDAIVGNDPSAFNRLEYWAGGLAALQAAPFFGLSSPHAGSFLENWVLGIDSSRSLNGFVNSYLDWGVSHGPLALGALALWAIWSASFPVGIKPTLPDGKKLCACGLSSAAVVFAVASIFSSLIGPVFAVNVILGSLGAVSLLLWFRWSATKARVVIAVTALATAAVVGALHFPTKNKTQWVAGISDAGVVKLHRSYAAPSNRADEIALICDREVMGHAYGKEARRFYASISAGTGVLVFPPDIVPETPIEATRILLFGRRWQSLRWAERVRPDVVLFHPLGSPDAKHISYPVSAVVLPTIDEDGSVAHWLTFARERSIPVHRTTGGHALLENWPSMAKQIAQPRLGGT